MLRLPIMGRPLRGYWWLPSSRGKVLRVLRGTYEPEQTAHFVRWIGPGATVIDVGTTPVSDAELVAGWFEPGHKRRDAFEKRGSLVMGDVHPAVEQVAGALTPVPGGVGPLTIAMLLKNTVTAALARLATEPR